MEVSQQYKKIKDLLNKYCQYHLLEFFEQLDSIQQQKLLDQIDSLDFSRIPGWVENYVVNNSSAMVPSDFEPAPSYSTIPSSPEQQAEYKKARKFGAELISAGKAAAFVVAGGQGTRLGFNDPKGNFPISPIRNKTLFALFAETILASGKKYGKKLSWYIMTSPLNHSQTIAVFEANNYYGMDRSDVFIFQQGTNPNFGFDGRILLAEKSKISSSPDGHGGSLKALYDSGAIADMKQKGIEYLSYYQVDNPLINIFDPLFIGLHALNDAEMSSKALVKANPLEKIGSFCLVDGKVTVIEYSDLPCEQANRRNPDGSLVFELGSIAIHIISIGFVEKLNAHGFALPVHRAIKKIPHIGSNGKPIKPTEPNGVKLETFVFDALPLASKSIILQTIRSEEFAPVKNATGVDSAEVTIQMMIARAAGWIESAGIRIPKKPDGSPDCVIEITPGFALSAKDVKTKADKIPEIKPGDSVYFE